MRTLIIVGLLTGLVLASGSAFGVARLTVMEHFANGG
jgi:hypothetical protein